MLVRTVLGCTVMCKLSVDRIMLLYISDFAFPPPVLPACPVVKSKVSVSNVKRSYFAWPSGPQSTRTTSVLCSNARHSGRQRSTCTGCCPCIFIIRRRHGRYADHAHCDDRWLCRCICWPGVVWSPQMEHQSRSPRSHWYVRCVFDRFARCEDDEVFCSSQRKQRRLHGRVRRYAQDLVHNPCVTC